VAEAASLADWLSAVAEDRDPDSLDWFLDQVLEFEPTKIDGDVRTA
jgi:hypothetical protein